MLDKDKSRLPVVIKDVIIIGIGVLVVWLGIWFAFGANPFYVVSSGSMVPVLKVNDVLIVRDGGSWDDLKIGDIIVFNRPVGGDRVIVHRIADIDMGSDGERMVRTRGDANPASIPGTDYPIMQDDYIGKVIYVIPGIGIITKVISPPVNYIIIAIILAILFFNRLGKKNKDDKNAASAAADSSDKPPT
ncbi:MAG TPA: signal peptidase I [Nitrososphaera sp.]|nr:signal peptidase I [Nitrososphaera sp.]